MTARRTAKPAAKASTKRATPRGKSAAVIASEQARCLKLRLDGLTVRDIADKVGLPKSTVQDRLDAAQAELVLPLADDLRLVELARLDRWQARLESQLDAGEDPVRVVPVGLRVLERRAKLLGLDAPERAEMTVHEVDAEDLELMQLIRDHNASELAAIQRGDDA